MCVNSKTTKPLKKCNVYLKIDFSFGDFINRKCVYNLFILIMIISLNILMWQNNLKLTHVKFNGHTDSWIFGKYRYHKTLYKPHVVRNKKKWRKYV